jgi:hypothetical protein
MSTVYTMGWHFTGPKLRDGRPIPPVGVWLRHEGPVVPCQSGLHASPTPWDALEWAPGNILHRVELVGAVPHGEPVDKYAASERKIIKSLDVEDIMRRFACDQALAVLPSSAPDIVRRYLVTADDSIMAAARDAAWADAKAAAWDAAKAAAWDAARAAAKAAAWYAAWDAAKAAAWDAARAAAWAAAWYAARAAAVAAAWYAAKAAASGASRDAAWDAAWADFNSRIYKAFGE